MPTITISKSDLESLLRVPPMAGEELASLLSLVKGEIKEIERDELRIELIDTNRPDLFCVEGIAREIKGNSLPICRGLINQTPADKEIIVSSNLKSIRPYICGVLVHGISLDEHALIQLIQTQEKLANVYGRGRRDIAIGAFNADKIEFPLFYRAVNPIERKFIPLDFNRALNLKEILATHPKGKAYSHILEGYAEFPILEDNKGEILSFPPIINSETVGKVKVGDSNLFCDITGTNLEQVILVANILAYNFLDRGAKVVPIKIKYPWHTQFGKEIVLPYEFKDLIEVKKCEFENLLGAAIETKEIKENLVKSGYKIIDADRKDTIKVIPPPYRRDVMHGVDVIEDFAIRKGYNSFKPDELKEFTVGKTTKLQPILRKVSEIMVGCGFEEIMSNILTSEDNIFSTKELSIGDAIEIDNPISESFSVLRNSIIPSLLKVEATSSKAVYPHKLFEIGEVVVTDSEAVLMSRTLFNLAALIAHPGANFSELHSYLDVLSYYLGFSYKLKKISHLEVIPPSFINGRVGSIIVNAQSVGLIGEIHPQVLENYKIRHPVSVFELCISKLLNL
ncbi:MAG: phenylalanine--tRNA ligase subunit beta [bacterium]|nr:phenylalanine--tRNA ligase subunit beta [bacterium]